MNNQNNQCENKKLTLAEHVIELRNRLIFVAFCFIITTAIAYYYSENIYYILVKPLLQINGQTKMIYTGLSEAFFTYLKLSFFAASVINIPVLVWQIYKFIAPGLYVNERKNFIPFLLATPLLFWVGAAFAYFIVFPLAWGFFIDFQQNSELFSINLEARVGEYLDIAMHLIIAFGLAFELPVLLILLLKMNILSLDTLISRRKYAIITIFIIAAVITPPDVLSQLALAIPMLLLYELVIIYGKRLKVKS